jgi:hypothetical protein
MENISRKSGITKAAHQFHQILFMKNLLAYQETRYVTKTAQSTYKTGKIIEALTDKQTPQSGNGFSLARNGNYQNPWRFSSQN